VHDIVEFLGRHAPFDDLTEQELDELATSAEVEFFRAGTTILPQEDLPAEHVRIVRKGTVELVDQGRVLDILREGEMFGHPSMLSGLPTGLEARAGEDTLAYRFPAEVVGPLLARPTGMRYLARSLLARPRPAAATEPSDADPGRRPAAQLIRDAPVVLEHWVTVRDAAVRMTEAGVSAALVRLADGGLGILTDSDLRSRVIAGGIGGDLPVTAVASTPVHSVTPDRYGAEVVLEMLDRDISHIAVVWPHGEVLGILSDKDLLALEAGTPFALRHAIDEAHDAEGLRRAAQRLWPTVIALHDAQMPPAVTGSIIAVVIDAVTRRLLDLAIDELGPGGPPAALRWLALGSLGRREVVPSSDVDSALVWDVDGDEEEEPFTDYMHALGARVIDGLAATGFASDAHGATAADPLFMRSLPGWRRMIRGVIDDPDRDKALVYLSLIYDARPVCAMADGADPLEELRRAWQNPRLLNLMLRLALFHRPPTGLQRLRDRLLEGDGAEHQRGGFDVKTGGILPIAGIARYGALAARVRAGSTPERLRSAGVAGTLDAADARTLTEAFEFFWRLRLEHQVEQLRRGVKPDDRVDPDELSPLTRRLARDAFHEVAGVQRKLRMKLGAPI
jgi:CBS domain-containing protein